ncbi:SCP-like protein [Teladorsagia circumcincta]|uniref:SCP-like protein n=1 Tax=Teladorsagia circumcincta TaxID=45464 RepID=A0A2G9UQA1_TELCI|nr:SCP-like protein [Teladorsagia circumcincta]
MYFQRYTCEAESFAQSHANSCDETVQVANERPGYKENVYSYGGTGGLPEAAEEAMNSWWGQLANSGIPSDMQFTQAIRSRTSQVVTRWTKMAWWNNVQLGCAIRQCNNFKLVVCMYSPGGNDVGRPIYNIGAPCSACAGECFEDLCS